MLLRINPLLRKAFSLERRLLTKTTVLEGEGAMSFGIYVVGFIVMIVGLALGANLLHVPPRWIGVGVVVLVGLGILTGVAKTRQKDQSS
jgi:hypothetical protein